jgi:hypothetical protein
VVTWCWSFLSGIVGVAAGMQGIYERYGKDFVAGALTLPGILYLLSRGAVPGLLFVLLYPTGALGRYAWLAAIGCGVSSEALLRSQFFIKRTETGQDIVAGPLDLLKFWQNLGLQKIGEYLANKRRRFVDANLPKLPFAELCNTVLQNLGALTSDETEKAIRGAIGTVIAEYQEATTPSDAEYRFKVGYLLYRRLGREEFKTIVRTN